MKTAIVSGGSVEPAFASGFLDSLQPDHIIAADRGLAVLRKMNRVPDYIVGDFDSLPSGVRLPDDPEIEIRRFRPEKDDTDTGIAAALAAEIGSDEVYILGATGTRIDHMIANLALLSTLASKGIRGFLIDAHNRISLLTRRFGNPGNGFCRYQEDSTGLVFVLKKEKQFGKFISFAPFGGPVSGLTLTGFKYPLTERTLGTVDAQLLVSNEITEEEAVVSFRRGALLMTESRD